MRLFLGSTAMLLTCSAWPALAQVPGYWQPPTHSWLCAPATLVWCACHSGQPGAATCGPDGRWSECACPPDSCSSTEGCRDDGECTSRDGSCVAATHQACRASLLCRERGRCFSDGDTCRAFSIEDCRASVQCDKTRRCVLNGEKGVCDDGTRRRSTAGMVIGIVTTSAGGAAAIVGALLLAKPFADSDAMRAASTALIMGGVLTGVVGAPILIWGAANVPRTSASLVVSPTSAAVRVAF